MFRIVAPRRGTAPARAESRGFSRDLQLRSGLLGAQDWASGATSDRGPDTAP